MSAPVEVIRIQPLLAAMTAIDNIPVVNQNDEERFYASAIRRLVRKLDRRLLPFLLLLGISSVLNRASFGYAKLMGLQTDLRMSESENNLVFFIFYIAHFLFDIPSNLLMRLIGSTRYLSLSMLAWGSITVGMAFVTNARQLLIVRLLIAVAEVGYFPCVIIYFSLWYCKREQTMRIASLIGAAIASRALAGILAYSMEKMAGIAGLKSWQWMFLLEGSPLIPLGIITYLFLDNLPNAVQWLDSIEKQLLTNHLRNDAGVAGHNPASSTRISWRQVCYVFVDWRIYLYGLITFGNLSVILSLTTFLPTLMNSTGSKTEAYLMTAPCYVVACVCCLLASYSSSRRNEHGYHVAFCLLTGLFGFILMLTLFDKGKVAIYVSISVTFCGIYSAYPLLLSWLTNNVGGHTKRAMAISFVTGIAQVGGVFMPLIYREDDKPTYRRGHVICSGILTVSLIFTIILRICLLRENHRRRNLSSEEYQSEAAIEEPCDRHPDVRYVL